MNAPAVSFTFTDADKKAYAAELLRQPGKVMDAAIVVFGTSNMGRTAYVAATWPLDPEIIRLQRELMTGADVTSVLPTKEQAQLKLWNWAQGDDRDTGLKAMKLLAEIAGWIVKPDDSGTQHEMPPAISYTVGKDHDKAPAS